MGEETTQTPHAVIAPFKLTERIWPVGVIYRAEARPKEITATQRIPEEEAAAFVKFAADVMANVWPLVQARLRRVRDRPLARRLFVDGLWAQPDAVRGAMSRWR